MSNPKYDVWCRSCGCIMKLRRSKFGEFYGCTGYPTCRNTMNKRDGALQAINEDLNNEIDGDLMGRWNR